MYLKKHTKVSIQLKTSINAVSWLKWTIIGATPNHNRYVLTVLSWHIFWICSYLDLHTHIPNVDDLAISWKYHTISDYIYQYFSSGQSWMYYWHYAIWILYLCWSQFLLGQSPMYTFTKLTHLENLSGFNGIQP